MIIDSHCHLYDPAFRDLRETIATALAHDVWGVVAVGCDAETNARTLAAAGAAPKSVWACLGFHPEWTHLGEGDLDRVEQQLVENHHRIVGLGEVGLPWYSLAEAPDPAESNRVFERLVSIAADEPSILELKRPRKPAPD